MFQIEDLFIAPVEVVGDEGYLLEKVLEGVAFYSPGAKRLTSTSAPHWGHRDLI